MSPEIKAYNLVQSDDDARICDLLAYEIASVLPEAESKIWHAHPVWFLDGNPVVGYGKLKDCIRMLFWSGESFDESGLVNFGKFKSAEKRYMKVEEIDIDELRIWLKKSKEIQWDYKNIVKRKGVLLRLK